MRRLAIVVVLALASVLGISSAAHASVSSGTPWTGYKFADDWICAQNDIGTTWNIEAASTAFEAGIVGGDPTTVNLTHYGPGGDFRCTDHYSSTQTLAFEVYSANDGRCWQMSYTQFGGQYTGQVTVWMNNSASTYWCRDTAQNRNNVISRAIGTALGLLQFYSDVSWQSSIMNTKFANLYNFAGTDDRNSLYGLYD